MGNGKEKLTTEELWSKGYSYGGGFYIHLHQKHIGAMLTHKPTKVNSLVKTFKNQRKNARQAIQTQYKELFLANVAPEGKAVLEKLFDDNGNIEKIDAVLKDFFQEGLNSEKVTQIIEKQRNIDWGPSSNFKKALSSTSKKWEGFDSLLTNIADSIELLNQVDGPTIAALIRNAQNKKTLGGVGRSLERALSKVNIDNTTIQGKNLEKAMSTLNIFASRIATGDKSGKLKEERKKDDDPITIEFLKSSIDRNFFSTILGESAAMDMQYLGEEGAKIYMKNAVENIKSTGKDSEFLLQTDIKGSYAGDVHIGEKRQGKADVKFNNITLSLDQILDEKQGLGEVTLNIGLSNKAYKTLSLDKNNTLTNKSLVTGGSMKINDVFSMLTSSPRIKYLGYNILAWSSNSNPSGQLTKGAEDITPALLALQDALFTRVALYLFGARGKIDFANFMFINGQLISMLDIVNRLINQNNIATTSTMNKGKQQGIIFSMPGRSKWWSNLNGNDIYNHFIRVQTLNEAINNSRIEGHINPHAF
jgi:hypothetical protein